MDLESRNLAVHAIGHRLADEAGAGPRVHRARARFYEGDIVGAAAQDGVPIERRRGAGRRVFELHVGAEPLWGQRARDRIVLIGDRLDLDVRRLRIKLAAQDQRIAAER